MGFIFIKETQGKRAFSAFFLFPHFYLLQRGANLLCFLQETVCAPHFFFSWAQEKKKRAAPGVKKKRTFGTTPGITVLLSRAAQCGATLHPVWCKADTALRSQPLPLSAFKIDVPRNRRTQFRLRPGGGSRRRGRSPLPGRWGEGFQRERRIETPRPLAVLCLLSVCTESKRGLGRAAPKENVFSILPSNQFQLSTKQKGVHYAFDP